MILKLVFIIIMVFAAIGITTYYFPDLAAKVIIKGTEAIIDGIGKITKHPIDKNKILEVLLPDEIKDLADKKPSEEKEYPVNIPPSEDLKEKTILGRPKKIVEFFCSSSYHCSSYFNNPNAKCELSSGICYLG